MTLAKTRCYWIAHVDPKGFHFLTYDAGTNRAAALDRFANVVAEWKSGEYPDEFERAASIELRTPAYDLVASENAPRECSECGARINPPPGSWRDRYALCDDCEHTSPRGPFKPASAPSSPPSWLIELSCCVCGRSLTTHRNTFQADTGLCDGCLSDLPEDVHIYTDADAGRAPADY